ncbi:MAG: hypothetical protein EPN43_11365 [Jatrophihabitans sp.]|nr:MAG: hypothetical protein EPN43_11365 [Jatrophihabitans sp.]
MPEPIPSVVPEPGAAAPNGRLRVAIDDELDLPFDEAVGRQVPDADATAPITPPSPQAPTSPQAPAAAAPAAVPDRYPVPPAATGGPPPAAASATAAVPRWAVRTPAAQFLGAGPQFVGDIVIDPASLRPKLTVRSGLSSLTVDAGEVRLRRLLSCERMPWSEVLAFEQHFTDGEPGPRTRGMLLAITPAGAVELPATRRLGGELPHLHALLDAYRIRAMLALSA